MCLHGSTQKNIPPLSYGSASWNIFPKHIIVFLTKHFISFLIALRVTGAPLTDKNPFS